MSSNSSENYNNKEYYPIDKRTKVKLSSESSSENQINQTQKSDSKFSDLTRQGTEFASQIIHQIKDQFSQQLKEHPDLLSDSLQNEKPSSSNSINLSQKDLITHFNNQSSTSLEAQDNLNNTMEQINEFSNSNMINEQDFTDMNVSLQGIGYNNDLKFESKSEVQNISVINLNEGIRDLMIKSDELLPSEHSKLQLENLSESYLIKPNLMLDPNDGAAVVELLKLPFEEEELNSFEELSNSKIDNNSKTSEEKLELDVLRFLEGEHEYLQKVEAYGLEGFIELENKIQKLDPKLKLQVLNRLKMLKNQLK